MVTKLGLVCLFAIVFVRKSDTHTAGVYVPFKYHHVIKRSLRIQVNALVSQSKGTDNYRNTASKMDSVNQLGQSPEASNYIESQHLEIDCTSNPDLGSNPTMIHHPKTAGKPSSPKQSNQVVSKSSMIHQAKNAGKPSSPKESNQVVPKSAMIYQQDNIGGASKPNPPNQIVTQPLLVSHPESADRTMERQVLTEFTKQPISNLTLEVEENKPSGEVTTTVHKVNGGINPLRIQKRGGVENKRIMDLFLKYEIPAKTYLKNEIAKLLQEIKIFRRYYERANMPLIM